MLSLNQHTMGNFCLICIAPIYFFWFLCVPQALSQSGDLRLVWSDEFNYTGHPDPGKWTYDVGDGCPDLCGWGNNEMQYYTFQTLENARVERGVFIIEAHRSNQEEIYFTSAKLKSLSFGAWKYGRIEVKAKLPKGRGVWPAIWMLPVDGVYGPWPASGEIDIMEHVGYVPDSIYGTVHTARYNHLHGTQQGGQHFLNDPSENFFTYAVDWTEEKIDFIVDEVTYFTFEKPSQDPDEWPFDKDFYLILNLAVGGNWGGSQGIDYAIWPQRFEIDYVRVYQRDIK